MFALCGSSLLGLFPKGEYKAYGLKKLFSAEGVVYRDYKTFTEAESTVGRGFVAKVSVSGTEGESVSFVGEKTDFELEIARLVITESTRQETGGILIVYGYTEKLGRSVFVDGKKVNVQLAYHAGRVTVGTPLILGSY